MPLLAGFDLETTGLLTPDHRIIEVYLGLWDLETKSLLREFEQRIDPERAIDKDAQRVHGISSLDLSGKPKWKEVAPDLSALLRRADVIVAHNGDGFDMPFTNQELARIGLPKITTPTIDTMMCKWATPNGKVPNLGELCFACGIDYDPSLAHAASYDVKVMMDCFFRALEWGFISLPDAVKKAA